MKNRPEIVRKLYHPQYDNDVLLAELKEASNSLEHFKKSLKLASQHPYTNHALQKNPFPQKLGDLRKSRPLPATNNLIGEAAWILQIILSNQTEIDYFIISKSAFEQHFLMEDYVKCENLLNEIEERLGVSFWSMECRFILNEYENGVESNWDKLSELSGESTDAFVLYLIEHLSKKAEKNLSYVRYRDWFMNKLEGLNAPNLEEYLLFRLSYSSYETFENHPFILAVESSAALVDRYLILVDVLFDIFKNKKPHYQPSATEILKELSSFKNDNRVMQMMTFINGKYDKEVIDQSSKILDLYDSYTEGNFEECVAKIPEVINSCAPSVELFELYAKSLIYSGKKFVETNVSVIVDEIIKNIYDLYSFGQNHPEVVGNLFKYSLTFQHFSWGKQIQSLATKYSSTSPKNIADVHLLVLNSNYPNPRMRAIVEEQREGFDQSFQGRISNECLKHVLDGNSSLFDDALKIPVRKNKLYQARALFHSKNYQKLITFIKGGFDFNTIFNLEREELVYLLYCSFLETNQLKSAIGLYVSEYLSNRNLTYRLDSEELIDRLQSNPIEGDNFIELPIFLRMYGTSSYDIYVAYDEYLFSKEINKPSELDSPSSDHLSRYIYFLSEVCTGDVMQYSLVFEGLEEVETERQGLLRILVKEDRQHEDEYIKEIAELTQTSKVRKAIQEVNKGRITVNIAQLKSRESETILEGFLRYQSISSYKEKNTKAVGLDVSPASIRRYIHTVLKEVESLDQLTNDPAYISFKSLFYHLRDKFLLSKEYGLDGYLSTRIRHGTLENHIRSVFENNSLIAERNKEGKYKTVSHWNSVLKLDERKITSVQKLLMKFSEKVDSLIQDIIKERIQIYTDKYNSKPKGLFNYNFKDSYLWVIFQFIQKKVSDHDTFIDYTFSVLQDFTETRLETIRYYFKTEVGGAILKELDTLQDSINGFLYSSIPELNAAIMSCRTDIQLEINKICDWFYLSNPTTDLVSDAETTLRTSVEITNSITPNHQIEAEYFGKLDLPIFGAVHIIYISRILLDNIIKHSGITDEKLAVRIGAEFPDKNTYRFVFMNKLATSVDTDQLDSILSSVKENWTEKGNFEMTNKEGGSGFDKIRRILAFDLKRPDYAFDYKLEPEQLTVIIDLAVTIESHETI